MVYENYDSAHISHVLKYFCQAINSHAQCPYSGLENRALRLPLRGLLRLYSYRAKLCWCIPIYLPIEMLQVWGGCALVKAVVLLTGAS